MKQKLLAAVLVLLVTTSPATVWAADEIPKPAIFARYEGMMNRSPFAVATAVVPPPSTPNFAKDLFIANAARLADEGVVTLVSSTDKNLKEYLSTKATNKNGYSISNIEWSDRVGATKVTIGKDGQSATLTFNQALMNQPVAGIQPGMQPPQPPLQPVQTAQAVQGGAPNPYNAANQIKPAPIPTLPNQPTLPTPPPRVRGVIQRNPAPTKEQLAKDQAAAQSAVQPSAQGTVQEATDQ